MKAADRTLPSTEQLEQELQRTKQRASKHTALRSALYTLLVAAAVTVLIATLWLPVLRIYGSSMSPTMQDGDILLTVKTASFRRGDIIAFYYNNKILVKRVIAMEGDSVEIDPQGTVFLNGVPQEEPYLSEKTLGEADISFPYQVASNRLFVMGDHRATSVDSRSSAVGCVSQEQIVGKIIFRVWPLNRFGTVS